MYGTLTEGGAVQQADRTVVVNEHSADGRYKLGVFGAVGLLTAGIFLYYWRIDIRKFAFEVRRVWIVDTRTGRVRLVYCPRVGDRMARPAVGRRRDGRLAVPRSEPGRYVRRRLLV